MRIRYVPGKGSSQMLSWATREHGEQLVRIDGIHVSLTAIETKMKTLTCITQVLLNNMKNKINY